MQSSWWACEHPERLIVKGLTRLHRPPCRGCAIAYAAWANLIDYDLDRLMKGDGGQLRSYTRREYIEMGSPVAAARLGRP